MRNTKLASSLLVVFALSAMSFAADVTGKWTGKIEFEVDKAAQAQMKGMVPKLPGLTLELRSNKSYRGVQAGGQDGKEHTSEGTWSFEGSTLKLVPVKRDGKAATGEGVKPRNYTLSKDGKTLTLDLSAQFKAAAKGAGGGKEVPQFKAKMVLRRTK